MNCVPKTRIRLANSMPVQKNGNFVLYWMIAFRRAAWNFSLDRAVEWAKKLDKPLVLMEALRCDYPWASDRIKNFVLDGMADNARKLRDTCVLYYPYVEPRPGAGKGLLAAVASRACVVITDDFPCFFLPRMAAAAARKTPVLMEFVDSNGLLPLRQSDRAFPTAFAFRRFLQKELPRHLTEFPKTDPLLKAGLPPAKSLPRGIIRRWPRVSSTLLNSLENATRRSSGGHATPSAQAGGGSARAQKLLRAFLRSILNTYKDARNEPERDATSKLSGHLHFGHISVHQIFHEIAKQEKWSPDRLAVRATGSRVGWWGTSESTEAFLDQVVTWRELGFNFCHARKDYDQFDSLPPWALETLRKHARDERSHIYQVGEFMRALTHDPLWNAAQTQLVREGRIHNYLRMIWGKKILEWTSSPRKAIEIMIELNNRYALDGRDPNSYSGIFWCLGRYDRPWGPERPIFGTVRYMSSANTARKFRVKEYLQRYAPVAT